MRANAPGKERRLSVQPRAALGALLILLLLLLYAVEDARADEFSYQVNFLPAGGGDFPDELVDLLPEVSQLRALQDRPPQSQAGLERRVQNDLTLLREALRSEGYYASKIEWRIEPGPPLQVNLLVETGPRFVMGDFAVEFPSGAPIAGLPKPDLGEIGIRLGEPARAAEVLAAERRMEDFMRNNGYPLAKVTGRQVAVELTTNEMQVTLQVDPGPVASFGPLAIEGLERLDEDYLRRRLQWPEGQRYSAEQLEQIRRDLVSLNLFDSVALDTASAPQADGTLPTTLKVMERAPRTVGIGVGFSTQLDGSILDGFSLEASWEHRNLFGAAESLKIEGVVSFPLQKLEANFRKPDFLELRQTLVVTASAKNETTDAFEALSLLGYVGLERPLAKNLTLSGGFSLELLQVDDLDPDDDKGKQRYVIAALPAALRFDNRDDPLNPHKGVFAQLQLTPSLALLAETVPFVTVEVSASTYYAPWDDDSLVLAVRGRLGSIAGGTLDAVPASKRFYAGGGGSVRGYELHSLGPLDSDDQATGGLSVFELGFEARTRFWDDYGLVAFVEGGQVYEDTFPDFSQTPQFGAGIGLRYFTELGPIRLDIATPLNGRDRDPAIQFYVSIGQAF